MRLTDSEENEHTRRLRWRDGTGSQEPAGDQEFEFTARRIHFIAGCGVLVSAVVCDYAELVERRLHADLFAGPEVLHYARVALFRARCRRIALQHFRSANAGRAA